MSGGLRDLLRLPEAKGSSGTVQTEEFGRAFRERMGVLNRNLQVVAAQASRAEFQTLEAQRMRLYEAFQKASTQIDSTNPGKAEPAIQRVMAAVTTVERKASELAAGVTSGRDQWRKRETNFDDAMLEIGELEEAGHPKASALRQLGEAIRGRAQAHKYQESVAALEQLRPKLDKIYAQHQQIDGRSDRLADGQTPDQPTTPSGETDLQASCIVTVKNNTSSVLRLTDQRHERGDFMTFPDSTLQPGASTEFVSVETTGSKRRGCQGFVKWDVEDFDCSWHVEWFNRVEKQNTARSQLFCNQPNDLHALEQIGQGEENVPTVFTLTDTGAPGETPPGTLPPDTKTDANVPVRVTDGETGDAIPGAAVDIAGRSATTGEDGTGELTAPVGPQKYRVSADRYDPAKGTVEVVEGENRELQIELTPAADAGPREGLSILVKDKETGDVINGTEVTVGDQTDTTSSNGLATVELPVGTHQFEAKADEYNSERGEVEIIEGDNPELVIEMSSCVGEGRREGLTILVKDKATGDVIEGADVTIGDQSDTTSSLGLATVELPVGKHKYEVSKEGYDSKSDEHEIIEGDNPELIVELRPGGGAREGLTIVVKDAESGEMLEGAVVKIGDQSDTTSSLGLGTVELPVGKHKYEVTKEGYESKSDEHEIIKGDNPELIVELKKDDECIHATLAVVVLDDETSAPISGAAVTVGDKNETTSGAGLAVLTLEPKTHNYEVSHPDYPKSETGTVEVQEGDDNELTVRLKREGATTLTVDVVDDGTSAPIPNASVTVGDQSGQTNATGQVVLPLQSGTHAYEATADGYPDPATGKVDVKEGDANQLSIRLKKELTNTTVTFHVTDEESGEPVPGATISGTVSGQTGPDGTFQGPVEAGAGEYLVSKSGFENASGPFEAAEGTNTDVEVKLKKEPDFCPPPESKQPTLRCGDESADGWVEYLQQLLNKHLGPGTVEVNGKFDKKVEQAVRDFQKSTKPPCLVDGIVGNETWSMLRKGEREAVGVNDKPDEQGAEARWATEQNDFVTYDASAGEIQMIAFSVGDQPIDGAVVTVKIVGNESGEEIIREYNLGGPEGPAPTGSGQKHTLRIPNVGTSFANDSAVNLQGYFKEELGGDLWTGDIELRSGGGGTPGGGGGETPGGGGGGTPGGGGGGETPGGGGGGGQPTQTGTATLEVHVQDGTSVPVKGVTVLLSLGRTADEPKQDTNAQGVVRFEGLADGEYFVNAAKRDIVWQPGHVRKGTLLPGKTHTITLNNLAQSGGDAAVLVTMDGDPVANATVSVTPVGGGASRIANSDNMGIARFHNVPIGEYTASATDPATEAKGQSPLPIGESANGTEVKLTGGGTPQPVDGFNVLILVSDRNGQPLEGATVTLSPGNHAAVTTGPTGDATFDPVPDGQYSATATFGAASNQATIVVNGQNTQQVVPLDVDSQSGDVGDVGVMVSLDDATVANATVTLTPVSGGASRTAQTDNQGVARFHNVPMGDYAASATDPATGATGSTPLTVDKPANGAEVTLKRDGTPPPPVDGFNVLILVSDRNGQPLEGATVMLSPGAHPAVTTGPTGDATFDPVPDGQYSATATFRAVSNQATIVVNGQNTQQGIPLDVDSLN